MAPLPQIPRCVALLKPPAPSVIGARPSKPPLELLSIASAAKDIEHLRRISSTYSEELYDPDVLAISIHDYSPIKYAENLDPIVRSVLEADLVGITATTPQTPYAHQIARSLRRSGFNGCLILGGPHISLSQEYAAEHNDFDYYHIGPGEESFPLLVNRKLFGGNFLCDNIVPASLVSSAPASKSVSGRIPFYQYPLPSRHASLIDPNKYDNSGFTAHTCDIESPVALIQTNRGCGQDCSFCSVDTLYRFQRPRTIADVVEEFVNYFTAGFRLFHLVDDIFPQPPSRALELADALQERFSPGEIGWVFNLHASARMHSSIQSLSNSDSSLIDFFSRCREGHCKGISIGVETGDPHVLETVDKTTDLKVVRQLTTGAQRAGLGVKWYLLTGLPGQDWVSIEKTVELIRACPPSGIAASCLIPHPGTRLASDPRVRLVETRLESLVACPEPPNRYTHRIEAVVETDVMSSEEVTDARNTIIEAFLKVSHQ